MFSKRIFTSISMGCLLFCLTVNYAAAKNPPQVGDRLEDVMSYSLPAPGPEEHRTYLGLSPDQDSMTLQELEAAYVLVEVVGVYCPVCHTQAPDMVRLFHRIQRDTALSGKLAMVALAAGATPMEVEHLLRTWRFPFPILQDGDYSLHKILGEPDTPFTFLIDGEGNVLYAHLGRINPDNLFNELQKLP
ncbi:Cytochrome oxidase Cu insertion factor, SCO1/SenC/PrrC family [Desulfonatronum thiosulfatophilum]|uniref:Cytochrome oxidase Cu insertion factor, SCO1/SenC/PrrC family n=1 Tax=Desulfonatronum thiosulfatophilum TaxID=617002 RepID=A0A1G6EDG6_9BACT|nr:TlpA disulfide reductase family protein [Desulfonatronum thiosulfatophilum]SDB55388.1 Cytochrome oxidase Cu insertion factor, SCO1/SenC/PrrC family [Desulfonatronum thiosulfatophilum]